MTPVAERLKAQNNGTAWRYCTDHGLKHQWVRTPVDPGASPRTLAREAEAGYYTCRRAACPAAGFGDTIRDWPFPAYRPAFAEP